MRQYQKLLNAVILFDRKSCFKLIYCSATLDVYEKIPHKEVLISRKQCTGRDDFVAMRFFWNFIWPFELFDYNSEKFVIL